MIDAFLRRVILTSIDWVVQIMTEMVGRTMTRTGLAGTNIHSTGSKPKIPTEILAEIIAVLIVATRIGQIPIILKVIHQIFSR